jgi:transcriptional regulator with XRE-family HTH domain
MTRKEIGSLLKARRKQLGLSQQDVADRAVFTRRQYYTEIENDMTNYGIDSLLVILNILQLGLDMQPVKGSEPLPGKEEEAIDFKGVPSATEEDKPKRKRKVSKS